MTQLLDSNNSILLLVDIQTRLVSAMPEEAAENMLEYSSRLAKTADLLNIPVFLTEQYPQGLGSTVESLNNELNSKTQRFEKTYFSCCAAEGFMDALEQSGRKQIIITGQEVHVCILQSALELMQQGYQVHILEDASCSRKAEHKFYALQRMQQAGATISNFESVLFEWLKDAKHPNFSEISQLLR
ncbi:MAG: hydrolase [Methyloprofundus sp.]|nr:hydrolase [Methyloprofundus sp.]